MLFAEDEDYDRSLAAVRGALATGKKVRIIFLLALQFSGLSARRQHNLTSIRSPPERSLGN